MSTNTFRIAVLGGDGVGPEVVDAAVTVLEAVAPMHGIEIDTEEAPIGGAAVESCGTPLPDATLELCRGADAILFGATGGPRWDHLTGNERPGSALLRLRRELGLAVNLRPVRFREAISDISPLRPEVARGTDILIVRELTGGIYFGDHGRAGSDDTERAHDVMAYTRAEIRRVVTAAFELAARRRGRLTSVDKANVLTSSRLWRETVREVAALHPEVAVEHQLVDSFAFSLVAQPARHDVVVTENLFGDILSDLGGVIEGSLGLLGSASLNPAGGPGLFEPVHGSAPDIAGRDVANPVGAIESAALLLEHGLGAPAAAAAVRAAVDRTLAAGVRTPDIGGVAGTGELAAQVVAALQPALSGAGA